MGMVFKHTTPPRQEHAVHMFEDHADNFHEVAHANALLFIAPNVDSDNAPSRKAAIVALVQGEFHFWSCQDKDTPRFQFWPYTRM